MYDVVFNSGEINRALRRLSPEVQRETRREMAAVARWGRDRIRADWDRGPRKGGHSFRAVTSGTRGLTPVVRLRRDYRPYVGWLVFGGRRRRYYRAQGAWRVDRQPRRAPDEGFWFYPGIAATRPEATRRARAVLTRSIRRAGLD